MQENKLPLAENEIELNEEIIKIKPVKLKYIIDGFYGYYTLLKKMGLIKLFGYSDGKVLLDKFLTSVFDNEQSIIDKFYEELNEVKMKELVNIVQKVNELEEEEDLKNV